MAIVNVYCLQCAAVNNTALQKLQYFQNAEVVLYEIFSDY